MLTSADTDNIGVPYYPADTVHGLQVNTLWDGLFHTFTWLAVLIGLGLLYARVTCERGRTGRPGCCGVVLVGWGLVTLLNGRLMAQCGGLQSYGSESRTGRRRRADPRRSGVGGRGRSRCHCIVRTRPSESVAHS